MPNPHSAASVRDALYGRARPGVMARTQLDAIAALPSPPLDGGIAELAAYVQHVTAADAQNGIAEGLLDPGLRASLPGNLGHAARLLAKALCPAWTPSEYVFAPGVSAQATVPRDAEQIDVLDPAGDQPWAPALGYFAIPAELRRQGDTPPTAPPELVELAWTRPPEWTPAELDDPARVADRWQPAVLYAGQGAELARRAAEARDALTAIRTPGDRRTAEQRIAALDGWAALYDRLAPAVAASLTPVVQLVQTIGDAAVRPAAGPAPIIFRN